MKLKIILQKIVINKVKLHPRKTSTILLKLQVFIFNKNCTLVFEQTSILKKNLNTLFIYIEKSENIEIIPSCSINIFINKINIDNVNNSILSFANEINIKIKESKERFDLEILEN